MLNCMSHRCNIYMHIAGKGIPNERAASTRAVQLPQAIIPEWEFAASRFEALGGRLTHSHAFGCDPLMGRGHLSDQRSSLFHQSFPDFTTIFHEVSNNNCKLFQDGLRMYINLTEQLSTITE